MLPVAGSWPHDGEIDVMEVVGHLPHLTHGAIHYGGPGAHQSQSGSTTLASGQDLGEGFHVYAMEWSDAGITWSLDDQPFLTVTPADLAPWAWPFHDRPFQILLNLAVGGQWPGPPDETTMFPQRLEVDWVRVFQWLEAPEPAAHPVTLAVDVSGLGALPAGSTPHLHASFNDWCDLCDPMSDDDGDGVWTIDVFLPTGSYDFKFSVGGWSGVVEVVPLACDVTGGVWENRGVTVTGGPVTTEPVCFGGCGPCATLPECDGEPGDVFTKAAIAPLASGSNDYQPPTEAALAAARNSIQALLAGDPETTLSEAAAAGYEVCQSGAADEATVIWTPAATGAGHARWALRLGAAREVIVESPHVVYDLDTLDEARLLFEALPTRALLASGTHRCANDAPAGCSGTTSACSVEAEPYRESDMAHTEASFYQAAHEALSEALPSTWVISVHGFGQDGASLSDGTTGATDPGAPVATLAGALAEAFPGEYITTCNPYEGAVHDVRLCGTSNTQGRHLNGSPAPCTTAASSASGRFIHLEQSKVIRASPELVAGALSAVAP